MSDDSIGDPLDPSHDEEVARELLGLLLEDEIDEPENLPDRTIRKVQNELTSRDLIDLTTFVFLMQFCAPLLDLVAAFFGESSLTQSTRTHSARRQVGANDDDEPRSRNDRRENDE